MKTKLFITGLAFMALTTMTSAQNQGAGQRQQNQAGKEYAWVDTNNDGVCDNFEMRKSSCHLGRNSQGKFNGAGQGRKQGTGSCGMTRGQGNQKNPVDTNKNGVCDFRETPSKN